MTSLLSITNTFTHSTKVGRVGVYAQSERDLDCPAFPAGGSRRK